MVNGLTQIGEFLFKCETCGAEIPSGIISLANHWADCTGKETMKNIYKIDSMPLRTEDKMDLIKQLFNIEQ